MLEIENGGAVAGSQYDVVNVSSGFHDERHASHHVPKRFGSSIQPNDTLDIVTAGSPILTTLAGSRIPATGAYSTFEVQLVNNGRTLRLANFQSVPATCDPNNNGLANLLEYGGGLDPTAVGGSRGIRSGLITDNGQANRGRRTHGHHLHAGTSEHAFAT